MLNSIVLIVAAVGVWGIYYAVLKGINQIIRGLESIDQHLANLDGKL